MGDIEENVQVAVRMRIFNQREKDANAELVLRMVQEEKGSKTWIRNPDTGDEKEFKFDYSFNSHSQDESVGPYSTQDTVFNTLGKPVLDSALEGLNVCLFAYGQTGAGKSFSMLGKQSPPEMQGIIPRSCLEIFRRIDAEKGNEKVTACVSIQVVEVYCEQINDLLADRKTWPPNGHKTRNIPGGFTCDTIAKPCFNYEDIQSAFQFADKNRSVGSHALNPESSRAHTIYQIIYERKEVVGVAANGQKQMSTKTARINLVDLAGSERMESAGTSGQMLKEGNAINLSLTALGNTIKALSEGKRPQFRESKLTMLLQASMTTGKVIMIAALSPASICYDESVSTLRFAERIKMVKIKAKKNVVIDAVAELKKEMEQLKAEYSKELAFWKEKAASGGGGGGGSAEEVEALRQEMLKREQEQKEAEEQMRQEYERRLKEMNETDADRAARAKEINSNWSKALGGASLEAKENIKVPHLLNLNEDPRLAETLIYTLDKEEVLVGRANKEEPPTLEFNGMGILKNHCRFLKEGEKMFLIPGKGARCCINGIPQSEKTELHHNYRVWLGNNYAFRFAFPGHEEEGEKFEQTPDYLMAEAEIAKAAASGGGEGGEVSALNHQLSDALKKVEQANIISGDLSSNCIFSPKIIKNRTTGDDLVVVHVTLPTGDLTWPWDKFNVRLVEMVKLWQNWQYCIGNDTKFELPPENPFIDNEYQLVGEADAWLRSLSNMIDLEVEPLILSVTGTQEGKLKIVINPLDKNGNEGPWEDDNEDLDPFVETVEELKGKTVQFCVKVLSAVYEVDLKDGGNPKYKDTWVRYKVNDRDPTEEYTETGHEPKTAIEAKFNHSKKFKLFVDDEIMTLFSKGKITFQVWGKLTNQTVIAGPDKALPTGWKRVQAFQAPDGSLHLTLPSDAKK